MTGKISVPRIVAPPRFSVLALLFALLEGCGASSASDPSAPAPPEGMLELDSSAELEGVRYMLEADFAVSGAESVFVTTPTGGGVLTVELPAGRYTIELQPDYRVYRDDAVVLTAIDAELSSEAIQNFEIVAEETTRVSYSFAVDAGSVEFGGPEVRYSP